jgi:hypothetical protein
VATAEAVVDDTVTAAQRCVAMTPGTLCPTAVQKVQDAARAAIALVNSCTDGPTETCGYVVWVAQQEVKALQGLEQDCLSRQNDTCDTVLEAIGAVEAAAQKCISMTPDTLCPATINLVESSIAGVANLVLLCITGANATCAETLALVQRETQALIAATADAAGDASSAPLLVVDFFPAPADAPVDPIPDPNAPQPTPDLTVDPEADDYSALDAAGTACKRYGTARWVAPADKTCPGLHWAHGYFYIDDRTDAAWPVQTYVQYWNQVAGLHVEYGCPAGAKHCVRVVDGRYGATGDAAQTAFNQSATHHFTWMTIKFKTRITRRLLKRQRSRVTSWAMPPVYGMRPKM